MKTVLHLVPVVALLGSFLHAPFDHFHENDPDHRHAHHWLELPEEGPGPHVELPDHDADAHARDWLAGDGTTSEADLAILPGSRLEAPVPERAERHASTRPCAHDPPARGSVPARAPPVCSHL